VAAGFSFGCSYFQPWVRLFAGKFSSKDSIVPRIFEYKEFVHVKEKFVKCSFLCPDSRGAVNASLEPFHVIQSRSCNHERDPEFKRRSFLF